MTSDEIYILQNTSQETLYEQLAEECAELTQVALKIARIKRAESPTPITYEQAFKNLIEEVSDVSGLLKLLDLRANPETIYKKYRRWTERLKQQQK